MTRQKTCNYNMLFGSSTRDRHAWHSENNIKCIMHDDLGRKNWKTGYILPCHWLYEWISQFHSCETYSVLSRSHSIVCCNLRYVFTFLFVLLFAFIVDKLKICHCTRWHKNPRSFISLLNLHTTNAIQHYFQHSKY